MTTSRLFLDRCPVLPRRENESPNICLTDSSGLRPFGGALTSDYSDRTYLVELESSEDEEDEFSSPPRAVSFGRWERNGKRYPLWLDNPKEVWKRRLIPVDLLRPGTEGERDFKAWVSSAVSPEDRFDIYGLGTGLRTRFANFNLPFLSLPSDTPKEVALDVFVKMNTSAQPLSTYDIVVAQVEANTGFSLHELVEELRREAPRLERFVEPIKGDTDLWRVHSG